MCRKRCWAGRPFLSIASRCVVMIRVPVFQRQMHLAGRSGCLIALGWALRFESQLLCNIAKRKAWHHAAHRAQSPSLTTSGGVLRMSSSCHLMEMAWSFAATRCNQAQHGLRPTRPAKSVQTPCEGGPCLVGASSCRLAGGCQRSSPQASTGRLHHTSG
jgi:hypothetical protein